MAQDKQQGRERTNGGFANKLELLVRAAARQHLLQLAGCEEELEVHFCVSVILLVLLHTCYSVNGNDAHLLLLTCLWPSLTACICRAHQAFITFRTVSALNAAAHRLNIWAV